jgi:hypothetical protein
MRILDPKEFGDLPEEVQVFWRVWYKNKMESLRE